jgi:hypothetical protein
MAPYGDFNEEAQAVWDFARCQRPDGSVYGSRGECKKGTEIGAKEEVAAKPKKTRKEKVKELVAKATPEQKTKIKKALAAKKSEEPAKSPDEVKEAIQAKVLELKAEMKKSKKNESKIKALHDDLAKLREGVKSPGEKTEEKLVKDLQKRAAKAPPVNNLSDRGKEAVRTYTQDDPPVFKSMNKCARSGSACGKETKKQIEELDRALQELPKNESGGSHFRGVNASGDTLKALQGLKPGDSFSDPGFSSYSRRVDTAREFAGKAGMGREGVKPVIIESRSKEMRGIERNSRIRKEQEAILPRNTPQTVREVREVNGTLYITVD